MPFRWATVASATVAAFRDLRRKNNPVKTADILLKFTDPDSPGKIPRYPPMQKLAPHPPPRPLGTNVRTSSDSM